MALTLESLGEFSIENGQLAGWILPADETAFHPQLAVLLDASLLCLLTADEEAPPHAPVGARGFSWMLPSLIWNPDILSTLKLIDLASGDVVAGPRQMSSVPSARTAAHLDFGWEPRDWRLGLAGSLVPYVNEIADGLWAEVDPQATAPRFVRDDPPDGEDAASWSVGLRGETEVNWILHQRLPAAALHDGLLNCRLWTRLVRATSNVTQCHFEICLSRWNGRSFERLRRLRRSRSMRAFSSTAVLFSLEPEERPFVEDGSLVLTVATATCFGMVVCPLVLGTEPAGNARFEDGRLISAFEACESLTRINAPERGRSLLMIPEPVAVGSGHAVPLTDIIVPVYNGSEVVIRCLRSVQQATDTPFRVWIIDDGSRDYTSALLEQIAAQDDRFRLHRRTINRGYTKSINEAIKLTDAAWVVILNSDTVVSQGWLRRLHDAAAAVPGAGMVGPLSNAASWQSVPRAKNADNSWSQNEFIEPDLVDQVQARLVAASERAYPTFPVLNGFCTLISRDVFRRCGDFDEEAFPLGYGEETDMCLRAGLAGFRLVVADDCFVYHEKSVSFGSATRSRLTRAGGFELRNKHVGVNVAALERGMQFDPVMARLRAKLVALEAELQV